MGQPVLLVQRTSTDDASESGLAPPQVGGKVLDGGSLRWGTATEVLARVQEQMALHRVWERFAAAG